jgi:hypothetical protein
MINDRKMEKKLQNIQRREENIFLAIAVEVNAATILSL